MLWFSKVIKFIKNYWYVPLIVIALIVVAIASGGKSNAGLIDLLKKTFENHKKEVNVIDAVHKQEIETRKKNLTLYHSAVDQVEQKYQNEQKKLKSAEKKRIKKIIEENSESPDKMTKEIADLMGFQVIMPE